jgi:hypothetical protein
MTLRQRQLAIFAVINLAIVAGGWTMLISPQRSHASAAAAQEQLVQNELAQLTSGGPTRPVKQPTIHTADLYALGTALPSQLDQPDLLFELDQVATESGVKIINISPQTPVAGNNFTVQPLNLSVNGTYFQLTSFIKKLRLLVSDKQGHLIANGPLFAVTSVALAPGQSSAQSKTGESATVGLAAYYYGMVGGASAPAATDTTTTSTTGG